MFLRGRFLFEATTNGSGLEMDGLPEDSGEFWTLIEIYLSDST
jgi:hypothetical protein